MRFLKVSISLSIIFIFNSISKAQNTNSGLKLFFEKVYLHTDRSYYAMGEDIWFKAYLVNAQSNYSTNTSKNLYAELISPQGNIITRKVIRLDDGFGQGDFRLNDSIEKGIYRIRAYTNWMKNFGNHFVFEKEIFVAGISLTGEAKRKQYAATREAALKYPEKETNQFSFFPEGGNLIEDLQTVVAFKSENNKGKGIPANGFIISSLKDTAAKFSTEYLGMGLFTFKPQKNVNYKVFVKQLNEPYKEVALPEIFQDGYALRINAKDTLIQIHAEANPVTLSHLQTSEVTIAARHGGKMYYKQKLQLVNGVADVNISKNTFPSGITAFTLYDEKLHPFCERLLYSENDEQKINVQIATDKSSYQARERTTVTITAKDANQQPVSADFSLAVTDDQLAQYPSQNIISYLMLSSELKGNIENVNEYFNTSNTKRLSQLDLLMCCQGWRSFLWRSMLDTSIKISYLPEQGISLMGKVTRVINNKPLVDMNVTLFASAARGNKLYFCKTDSSGKYYMDGLPLYGEQTIKINSKNNKGEKGGLIWLDSLYNNQIPVPGNYILLNDTTLENKTASLELFNRISKQKELSTSTLPDVVVKANQPKTFVTRDGEVYTSFGYPVYNLTPTNQDFKDFGTLENYLLHKIPGATPNLDSDHTEGIVVFANGKRVTPRFFVEKREDVFDRMDYYQVQLKDVLNVRVEHYVNINGDMIQIHLSLKPEAFNQDPSLIITEISGYYSARRFYIPPRVTAAENAKPDARTTIFWEPNVHTDANGKAVVEFFNADPKTTIKISTEGLTNKGVPVMAVEKYKVQ